MRKSSWKAATTPLTSWPANPAVLSRISCLTRTAACAAVRPGVERGELPPSAPAWLAGVKLAVLGGFAWIGGSMALCQPLPEHFSAVFMAAALLPVIGFLVSAIRFAAKRKTR